MKIVACVKRVPTTEATAKLAADGRSLDPTGWQYMLSFYDELAVEEALKTKEKLGGEVTVVTLGPADASKEVRECLARGADHGVILKDADPAARDPRSTAKALAAKIKALGADVVFTGRVATDRDHAAVGPMLATYLGWACVGEVHALELGAEGGTAKRETEHGVETVTFRLPAVITCNKGLNEPRRASLECIGAARSAGGTVVAVTCGAGADAAAAAFAKAGASEVLCLAGSGPFSADATAADLAAVVKESGAKAFLAPATVTGKDIAPRVAAHLDATLFSDVTGFASSGASFQVVRPWLAGKALATLTSSAPVFCATTRPNAFAPGAPVDAPKVSQRPATAGGKATVTAVEAKTAGKLDVKEAGVVVSGGRGMKGPENFGLIEQLAAAFGNAATGASRAVVDAGWRPHAEQVGQTGKTVAPQLYIAVGISGAIQHLAGMRTSKVIVAINKDKDAPIFKLADYGIVGDALEVLPALTAAVKAAKAQH